MLGKNFVYRGYSLSDTVGWTKRFALQDLTKNATIRGSAYPFSNSFGSIVGPRIAESRLFSFIGKIHNVSESGREQQRSEMSSVFHIESNLNDQKFYDLTWETKDGNQRVSSCMVYTPLQGDNDVCNPIIDFSFELVSPDPRIYDPTIINETGGLGQGGAGPLWNILPFEEEEGYVGLIECQHDGDWDAPMRIEINGNVVNPKVFVLKDGEIKYFFKIEGTTNTLVIDNTDTVSQMSDSRFVVTDNGVNIKALRQKQQGGGPLFIPATTAQFGGDNLAYVLVLADNYIDAYQNTVVNVSYRNTYSH